ncbi:MAG TPA: DUF5615 family PIN-like protein [Longimicrobium sp.]|nr:DUF5615 family PIN-like protein [Longimicrobium sp.]
MSDPAAAGRRVLLDEMLPRLLATELPDHQVSTVAREGWTGVLNGELLRRAKSAGFEVFLTADRNMEHQQRLTGRRFGVVVIVAGGTKLDQLRPLGAALRQAVAEVGPGEVRYVQRPLST